MKIRYNQYESSLPEHFLIKYTDYRKCLQDAYNLLIELNKYIMSRPYSPERDRFFALKKELNKDPLPENIQDLILKHKVFNDSRVNCIIDIVPEESLYTDMNSLKECLNK
jgi:hypothetical protein